MYKSPYCTLSPFLAGFVLEGHCLPRWQALCLQIDAAQCYDPRDRTYILGVIADRWSVRGGVAGFETDVREGPIFHAIEKELGGNALFRYVDAVVLFSSLLPMGLGMHASNDHAASHAATTVLGVFLALPLAIYAHARITARIAATREPYAVRLALTVLAFVGCVTAASLLCFEACRAPCQAWVGVGCLRA